jgi:hypothetical protein
LQITSQNFNGGGGAVQPYPTNQAADFMGYAFGPGWTKKLIKKGFPVNRLRRR